VNEPSDRNHAEAAVNQLGLGVFLELCVALAETEGIESKFSRLAGASLDRLDDRWESHDGFERRGEKEDLTKRSEVNEVVWTNGKKYTEFSKP